jgi:hypothetical protein
MDVAGRKVEGSNPGASRPPPVFETGRRPLQQHLPGRWSRRSDSNGRPLPSEGAPCSAELRRAGTRGQLPTDDWGLARPVLFATPPGSVALLPATRPGRGPVTSDRPSDGLPTEITRQGDINFAVGLAGIEPAASAPRTPRAPSLRYSPSYSSEGRG